MDISDLISGNRPLPSPAELLAMLKELPEAKQKKFIKEVGKATGSRIWMPLPGPQTEALLSTADIIGFGGAAGGGKGLALNTMLPTPSGWTTMGEVAPGDYLIDDKGKPCRVLAVSEISNRPCFRLTFDDGSQIIADDVHRWLTFDALELAARTGTVRSTAQIADSVLTENGKYNHAIPEAPPCRRTGAFRYIVSCDPVETVPTRCLSVDSPSRLYLAGTTMIPTHNTDLICGLVLEYHERSIIFRREKAQTEGIVQRLEELRGSQDGFNSQKGIWKMEGSKLLEFGGLANPDDRKRYQGRAHDLKAYDEATEIPEDDVRWTMGWARTNNPDQRVRRLLTFNPPDTAEGRWIIRFFAPWLDKKHQNRAAPGEIRYFATVKDDPDREVVDGRPFVLVKNEPVYEFDRRDYQEEDVIVPLSRTFIPSRITNNPYYVASGYLSQLQAMPEPYRSRLLYGDFEAGMEDAAMQVIPTAWVEAAMERWRPASQMPQPVGHMDSMGVDVARGGRDNTVISRRHGTWFDDLVVKKGADTTDGAIVAGLVMQYRRHMAPVHVDVVGWGASVVDHLRENQVQVVAINGASKATALSADGNLKFLNLRAEQWWRMREALDPKNETPIALPDDSLLLADLTSPLWRLGTSGIQVESKDDLRKRIGRSPDRADAVIYALVSTMKAGALQAMIAATKENYNPFEKDWR